MKKSWMKPRVISWGTVISQMRLHGMGYFSALFLMASAVTAVALQSGDYTYEMNSGNTTVTITGYSGPGGAVAIPSTLAGLPVTGIGNWAFYNCSSLTGITIPAGVTNIGSWAFEGCYRLTGVMIPAGVTSIGDAAFRYCQNLTTIAVEDANPAYGSLDGVLFDKARQTLIQCPGGKAGSYMIPDTVTNIGSYAFEGCYSLTGVTIPAGVTGIGNSAFCNCFSLTGVTIGSGVTSIGDGAFGSCQNLTSIAVADANPAYGSQDGVLFDKARQTLIQCPGGKAGSYMIPDTVTNIGSRAFEECYMLTGVTIPASVTGIGEAAFRSCKNLTSIAVEDSNPAYGSQDGVLFDKARQTLIQCPGGKAGNYMIPAGVTRIGNSAFWNCSSLTGVTIGSGVTNIGNSAFAYCWNLTSALFKGNVPGVVGSDVFYGCNKATVYYLPGAAGWGATFGGLPAVLLPFAYTVNPDNTVTVTGYAGPGGAVTIPADIEGFPVTAIGASAFSDCTTLTIITVPASVTSIGNNAFSGCANLAGVFFIGNAPAHGMDVFTGADNATVYYVPGTTGWGTTFGGRPAVLQPFTFTVNSDDTITITGYSGPGGVVAIPSALAGLPVTGIGDSAFCNCSSLTGVTIPASVTSIGGNAFSWCNSLTGITIGAGVTNIGDSAFAYCWNLTSVLFKGNVPGGVGSDVFAGCDGATVYYLPGATGWGATFGGLPAVLFPFTYTVNPDNTVTVTGYTGFGGAVTIPSTIGGLPVTAIGASAFAESTTLIIITVPASVTFIGNNAFSGCANLAGVFFIGNAPALGMNVFTGAANSVVYYRPGTTGWGTTFGGRPAVLQPFTFTVNSDDTITITGYSGPGGAVAIPSTLAGLPVTGIGDSAFSQHDNLTAVTLPDGVVSIGDEAFYGCSRLTSVVIPDSVTSIGYYAFYGCSALTDITIGISVTSIGEDALTDCTHLTNITVAVANETYSSTEGILFNKDQTVLIQYPGGRAGTYTLPGGVATIGYSAFSRCGGLTSVTIPDSVICIEYAAFHYCSGLTSVMIPNGVTSLSHTFCGCTGLTDIMIGNGVNEIGDGAFNSCTSLTNISVAAVNETYSSANGVLFDKGQTELIQYPGGRVGRYTIPDGVTGIGDEAFAGCSGLTHVAIPGSVTSIGNWAFYDCSGLISVEIGNGVTSIGEYAFGGCNSLVGVFFGGDAPNVDGPVFGGDNQVTVYYLPGASGWESTFAGRPAIPLPLTYTSNSGTVTITGYTGDAGAFLIPGTIGGLPVTSIGNIAFYNCTGLTMLTIPGSVSRIGDYAFLNCSGLVCVFFEGNAPSVGSFPFFGADKAAVIYPPGSIGWSGTFAGRPTFPLAPFTVSTDSSAFTVIGYTGDEGHVAIPDTLYGLPVTVIGDGAFSYHGGLTSVTIGNGVTRIGDSAFEECYNLTNVTIGTSVASIGRYAFGWCEVLSEVSIPQSVTNIGNDAFGWCASLTNITVAAANANYSSANGVLFNKGQTELIQYPGGRVGNYTIPGGVTSIGNYAFGWCDGLIRVTIPASMTNIGDGVFDGCYGLTGVYFKGDAPSAGEDVFGCDCGGDDYNAIVYRLSGAAGWPAVPEPWCGRPTALWELATSTSPVPVPYAWLDQYPALLSMAGGDYEAAALSDADLDGMLTWQEYVAGTVPANRDSVFLSLISVSNGKPLLTWTPDLGAARVYTADGCANLTEAVWGPTNAASRFFRVKVQMP